MVVREGVTRKLAFEQIPKRWRNDLSESLAEGYFEQRGQLVGETLM